MYPAANKHLARRAVLSTAVRLMSVGAQLCDVLRCSEAQVHIMRRYFLLEHASLPTPPPPNPPSLSHRMCPCWDSFCWQEGSSTP